MIVAMMRLAFLHLLLLLTLPLPTPAAAGDDATDEEPPPVEIGPKEERVEVIAVRPGGGKVVRITPPSGEPYCLEIKEPDPMDQMDPGYSARVRCP